MPRDRPTIRRHRPGRHRRPPSAEVAGVFGNGCAACTPARPTADFQADKNIPAVAARTVLARPVELTLLPARSRIG